MSPAATLLLSEILDGELWLSDYCGPVEVFDRTAWVRAVLCYVNENDGHYRLTLNQTAGRLVVFEPDRIRLDPHVSAVADYVARKLAHAEGVVVGLTAPEWSPVIDGAPGAGPDVVIGWRLGGPHGVLFGESEFCRTQDHPVSGMRGMIDPATALVMAWRDCARGVPAAPVRGGK